jgi:pimeloyl-[acyl-carrier protein] synthase
VNTHQSTSTDSNAQSLDQCLLAPDFYSNVHTYYRQLRSIEPVHWSEALGSWFLTGYHEILNVHRDPQTFSSIGRVTRLLDRLPPETQAELALLRRHYSDSLINSDPPRHTRLRKLFNKPFLRSSVTAIRPRIQAIVDDLLTRLENSGRIDLIRTLAYPLPIAVICDFVCIDVADRPAFLKWSNDLSDINVALTTGTPDGALAKQASLLEMRAMMQGILTERKRTPGGDLFTALLNARDGEQRLSDEEIIRSLQTLIIGSHETTTNLIGNAIWHLGQRPDLREQLVRRPELIESAVEEFLRFDSPLNHNTRIATRDCVVGSQHVEAGQLVTMSLVAANRDPRRFPDPDRLDLERPDNQHIAFGLGSHFCLGAPLARAEAQIAILSFVRRFPRFELVDEPRWRENLAMHGLLSLELAL